MAGMAEARVGISGWMYPPWRGVFYPRGVRQADELEYASRHVTSIEINGSFYSLQKPANWISWRDRVPADFVFAVKGPRFITHMKRLGDIEAPLANFFASGLLALGPKLGPVLWQLPPNLAFDEALLDAFLARLPRTHGEAATLARQHDEVIEGRASFTLEAPADRPLRHAIEVRHPSFETDAWRSLLERHHVASVIADTAGKYPRLDWVTADFAYARLHGDKELYTSGYDDEALERWETWVRAHLAAGRDTFVYFDNDVKVRAPFDAMALIERLDR